MKIQGVLRALALVAVGALVMLAADYTVLAQRAGGGSSHASAGAGRGGYGYAASGWHGGYGGYGGYGWRGRGWGGYWGWGLGWGWWPVGVYLSVLPWYYATYWWDGIPYYYADNAYYMWNADMAAYEQVLPPAGFTPQAQAQSPAPPAASTELFAYPKNGQSAAKQASDKSECRAWAASQTTSSPTANGGAAQRQDYLRAEAACLEGRGYAAR